MKLGILQLCQPNSVRSTNRLQWRTDPARVQGFYNEGRGANATLPSRLDLRPNVRRHQIATAQLPRRRREQGGRDGILRETPTTRRSLLQIAAEDRIGSDTLVRPELDSPMNHTE